MGVCSGRGLNEELIEALIGLCSEFTGWLLEVKDGLKEELYPPEPVLKL